MGNPLLDKQANPAATAVNNAGTGHEEIEGNPLFDHRVGVVDGGLGRRPDYGEKSACGNRGGYTGWFEIEAEKEASDIKAEYGIAVQADAKVASIQTQMFVSGADWDGLKLKQAHLTADLTKAVYLPWFTARQIARELPKMNSGLRTSLISKA